MADKKYTKDHEWVMVTGDVARIGISDYAQEQLGDLVFVEAPEVGRSLGAGEEAGVVESVKAASDLYAPVSGTVSATNDKLADEPELVNSDAEGEGWIYECQLADAGELDAMMDEAAYKSYLEGLD